MTLEELLAHTTTVGECRIWKGHLDRAGYGGVRHEGRNSLVHRVVYVLAVGPIPPGYEVDHLCFRRACLEPTHLEAVSRAENHRRRSAHQTACRRAGHDWAVPRNVRVRPDGRRYCAECRRQADRESYHRLRKVAA